MGRLSCGSDAFLFFSGGVNTEDDIDVVFFASSLDYATDGTGGKPVFSNDLSDITLTENDAKAELSLFLRLCKLKGSVFLIFDEVHY